MFFFHLSLSIEKGTVEKEAAGRFPLRADADGRKGKEDYRLAGVRRSGGAGSFDRGLSSE